MAATHTIQDIDNPDLSYDERRRLRKEMKHKRAGSTETGRASPSRPFRTHSPTLEPSVAPMLGYVSEYAYVKGLSPSPVRKQHLKPSLAVDNLGTRDRAVSEPVSPPEDSDQKDRGSSFHSMYDDGDDNDNDFGYPQFTPTVYPYDSRTPRLARGAGKKSNIIYRKDLDDFNKQDITVVMFPRDATLDRRNDVTLDTSNVPTSPKKGLLIVPSAALPTAKDPPTETTPTTAISQDETKINEGSTKPGKKISKTFSFLSKKGEKKKSPKPKRKQSTEKRMSSGGLSGISMPNLHNPPSDEPISSDSPDTPVAGGKSKNYSIFRRKGESKKSSVQRTSWTFQPPTQEKTVLQPATSLQNIAESPTREPSPPPYDTIANQRTGSMELIPQFTGGELNPPVTVFESSHRSDDEEDLLPSNTSLLMLGLADDNNGQNIRSPSPLSIGSISIDLPELESTNKPVTPLPTPNDITSGGVAKNGRQPQQKTTPFNAVDGKKSDKTSTFESDSSPIDGINDKNTDKDSTEDESKNFKRNLGSRKPLRKTSVTGKESPSGFKKRYSSLRSTPESTTQSISVSPSRFSLNSNSSLGDSPRTTPTNKRKSNTSSPISTPEKKTTVHNKAGATKGAATKKPNDDTPTNSPRMTSHRSTPPPLSKPKFSPANSPLSSPVQGKKSTKSSPNATPKLTRSTLASSSFKTSPKASHKSPNLVRQLKTDDSPKHTARPTELKQQSTSDSSLSKKRRLGITSITSPLSEEKKLEVKPTEGSGGSRQKIIPKRVAPMPPETTTTSSEVNLNSAKSVSTAALKDKPTMANSKQNSVPSVMTTKPSSGTYVYRKAQTTQPAKEQQATYKYSSGSFGKKTSEPEGSKFITDRLSHDSQRRSSIKKSSLGSLASKPPAQTSSSRLQNTKITHLSTSSSSIKKLSLVETGTSKETVLTPSSIKKLSLVETGTPKAAVLIPKSSSEDRAEDGSKTQQKEEASTLDILGPIDSILSSSSSSVDKPTGFARTISPLSSDEEGDISLTPEVPLNHDDEMTYIYRSTLLRKINNDSDSTQITRTASNKSINLDSVTRKSISRTTSPRKSTTSLVSGSPTRQSKRVSTGTLLRKGSVTRSSIRKNSTNISPSKSQTLSKRPSSGGVSRPSLERVSSTGGTSTLGRPRSASQVGGIYHSQRKSSKSSVSSLARQSLRNKKMSADSISSLKRPSSGLQASKKSTPSMMSSNSVDGTSASKPSQSSPNRTAAKPPTGLKSSASIDKVEYSKPKPLTKAISSSGTPSLNKTDEARKSIRMSKSVDQPPKLQQSQSAFLKPPSGSTLGRSSIKQKKASADGFQNSRSSIRMSRRSSTGTVKKVSQSSSPLHSSNKSSPSHNTLMRKSLKRDDTVDAFDHVSSMADKTKLTAVSDYKRQLRPKTKYRPSPGHLQMLSQRKDVSTELATTVNEDPVDSGVDPNSYSTYMGKKKLDKTALAGLAAKLDFTTVQLRKTGIVEQMMTDPSGGGSNRHRIIDEVHNSYGVQVTTHPLMLLMIKGRKNLQTRLVEPAATSINSGDVFILVSDKDLFMWQGKEANVLEKARANDIVNRIHQKRELGCRSNGYTHLDDQGLKTDLPKKHQLFWELLKGKPSMRKDINIIPNDEAYERGVSSATKVYQFVMEGEVGKFQVIHEDSTQPLKISLLDTKKILLFDFCSEVYVWMGKRSQQPHRKPAMIKARKHYDSGYLPPVFSNVSTPKKVMPSGGARQSGRFHSKIHQRHGTLSGSIRRRTLERKTSKGNLHDRASWCLFARVNEGSETILFREKFADWPEPGRIIKMKGHESSGEIVKAPPMPELEPADVQKMLKPHSKFEGMRLEGENIHRGHGNYKVSRSTFACNRVRSQKVDKYLVKDSDNVLLPESVLGIFYSGEGYVFRWKYIITVVRELEGLTPGEGMFAKDRKYQKELLEKNLQKKNRGNSDASVEESSPSRNEDDSSDEEVDESDDESKRVLESGGRDRVAYFFWQGEHASINEKGAAAVMTVEMDKERAPQIRVTQGKEHPAFLQLFKGTMVILNGKSESNSVDQCPKGFRLYAVIGNAKKEACLVEICVENHPLFYYTRSRGCYVIQHKTSSLIYLWIGSKATEILVGVGAVAARNLRRRLNSYKVVKVNEGSEPKELNKLMGSRNLYHSLISVQKPISYTPRLFHMSSSTGWFIATEETHISMPDSPDTPDPFPFYQEDLYNSVQPALYLLDADTEIYLWMGWWPVQKNKLLQEKNAFSGLAQSRWAKEKKLALETAMMYAEGCKRNPVPTVYVVNAGTEHVEFTNLFPIWNEKKDVQEIVGNNTQSRTLAEKELAKYNKKTYTLQELLKRPEEVDPSKLETYLSDEDFEKIFKTSRDDFSKMLLWKQVDLKKRVGLF